MHNSGTEKKSLHIYFQINFHWALCGLKEQKLLTSQAKISAFTLGRQGFFSHFSLLCLKARCPVHELPSNALGKDVPFYGEAEVTYFEKE